MTTTSETMTFLLDLAGQLERRAAAYRTAAAELNGHDPSGSAAAVVAAAEAAVIEPPETRARGQRTWTPEQKARASRQAKKRARTRKAAAVAAQPPTWSEGRRAKRARSAAALAKFDDTPRTPEEAGVAGRTLASLVRWGYLKRKGTGKEKRYVRTSLPFEAVADES